MSIESNVELLWNCALALKGDQQIHKILKSYYVNTCRKLSKNNILLPKEKLASSQICPYCGNCWYEGELRVKLIPRRLSNNAKARKLIKISEKNNDPNNRCSLNKKQRKRAKWLRKKISNFLQIECENCKRKSMIKLEAASNKGAKTVDPNFNKYQQHLVNTNSDYKVKPNGENDRKAQQNTIKKKETKTSQQKKRSAERKLHQIENKSVQRERKTMVTTTTKVISKTQKQNNLLQLAALLKKNPQKESKQKMSKLDSFLK